MLELHEWLARVGIKQEKMVIEHQIEVTDKQIDRLVYELYRTYVVRALISTVWKLRRWACLARVESCS